MSCCCDCSAGEMPHTKTNENRIKAEHVHFICLLILWCPPLIYSASRPVENKLCKGPIPNRSQLCQIPCPIDCEVSPWAAWGPCTFENCDDQAGKKGTKCCYYHFSPSTLFFFGSFKDVGSNSSIIHHQKPIKSFSCCVLPLYQCIKFNMHNIIV